MQILSRKSIALSALFMLIGATTSWAGQYCGPTAKSELFVDLTQPISAERPDGLGLAVSYRDGTSIIVGDTTGGDIVENHDDHITKIDDNGHVVWKKLFKNDGLGFFLHAAATADGGLIVTGNSLVTLVGPEGSVVWAHSEGRDEPDIYEAALQLHDGSFLLVGARPDPKMDRYHGLMKRVSMSGDVIWSKIFDEEFLSYLKAAVETKDGAIVGVGTSGLRLGGGEISGLVKTNSDGDLVWNRQFEAGVDDVLYDLASSSDNTVVAVGTTRSRDKARDYNGWILKVDRDGELVWENLFKTGYLTNFPNVEFDSSGSINAAWRLMLPEFHDLKHIECGYVYDTFGNLVQ